MTTVTVADIQAEVSTVRGSVERLLTRIIEMLRASNAVQDQAKMNELLNSLKAERTALSTAVAAGTAAADEPVQPNTLRR